MSLAQYQDAMFDFLFDKNAKLDVHNLVMVNGEVDHSKQFDLIRQNTLSALHIELVRAFPITKRVLGANEFRRAAYDYFQAMVPQAINPMIYCQDFPEFLETFTTDKDIPYLADVATLDFGCYQSEHAMDASPIKNKIFTDMSPEELASKHLQLHPACFWMASPFSIYDVWYRFNSSTPKKTDASARAQEIVIMRSKNKVEVHKIDKGLIKTLDSLDSGETLNQSLNDGAIEDPSFNAVAAIQFLVQNGLIVAIY